MKLLKNERGIALATALLMSLVIMLMVVGTYYFTSQATKISGLGKAYATADEAAAGAVDIVKDSINSAFNAGGISSLFPSGNNFTTALYNTGTVCNTSVTLPSSLGGQFTANITLERLFSRSIPGSRLEFARAAGGAPGTAIYYRITARVTGPNDTSAENSVFYRFAG